MRKLILALLLLPLFTGTSAAAGLALSIQDGKVSIDAQDVTIRQILTEWARIGKTKIVNIERLMGGPITIKFDGVPEKQALEIVLRTVPGFVAAPRETFESNASVYSTILIMATTTPVAALRPTTQPPAGMGQGNPNITQLRTQPPPFPAGIIPDPQDLPSDPQDEAALAAAAGLIAVPALTPPGVTLPLQIPGMPGMPGLAPPQPGAAAPAPAPAPVPNNPWNAPTGTARPSLPTPPAPATQTPPQQQIAIPRLPQPDR